eukprot:1429794-Amphidinium_carterae.1
MPMTRQGCSIFICSCEQSHMISSQIQGCPQQLVELLHANDGRRQRRKKRPDDTQVEAIVVHFFQRHALSIAACLEVIFGVV